MGMVVGHPEAARAPGGAKKIRDGQRGHGGHDKEDAGDHDQPDMLANIWPE